MATSKNQKSAARGTKAEGSVRLGSEFITREDLNARFPICKMAQDVINALKLGGDKSSAFHLTNCFRGFSKEMQEEMAYYLIAEMHYRITGKSRKCYKEFIITNRYEHKESNHNSPVPAKRGLGFLSVKTSS